MKYKKSGVDIDRANQAKKAIARHVKSTWGEAVLSETGAFGGLFSLGADFEDPVLVSSIDGVGTKLLVAVMAGRYDTIGRDLVNHCVNDILVQGARPLFFLDYLAAAQLDPDRVAAVVDGIATACRENQCALIGGETAEMPGLYHGEDFDLAGCIVGAVERGKIIDGSTIEAGDLIYALPSTGLHTNGYSLARTILFEELGLSATDRVDELGGPVGDELLKVHASYLGTVTEIAGAVTIKGLAHVTGGGIVENLPRILPDNCDARIQRGTWPVPPIFSLLQTQGAVSDEEMYRVFNMGAGMLVVLSAADGARAQKASGDLHAIGSVVKGSGRVEIV
jgi:phosphoribosylformylglycinamidine cyclo-ligase